MKSGYLFENEIENKFRLFSFGKFGVSRLFMAKPKYIL